MEKPKVKHDGAWSPRGWVYSRYVPAVGFEPVWPSGKASGL